MMNLLGTPLGYIMYWFYNLVGNYGLALVLFTVFTKLVLLPLAINTQKNTAKMALFKPKIDEIQAKYKNNPTKMNEELQDLYAREKYNPMSGCLPTLIQFPILIGLINVIYYPLKHILHIPTELTEQAIVIMQNILDPSKINRYSREMSVITAFQQDPGAFASLGEEFVGKLSGFDFTLFGIDLGAIPSFSFGSVQDVVLLMVPVLSGLTALCVSLISMKANKATMGNSAGGAGMNASMMLMMPLMSAWIAFTVPVGVGMYWVLSNIYTAIQQFILSKVYNPGEMAEKARAEIEEQKEREKQEKKEARKKLKEAGEELPEEMVEKALSQKEINRRKLAEARRRDAEKYGEEYVEVTDADLE